MSSALLSVCQFTREITNPILSLRDGTVAFSEQLFLNSQPLQILFPASGPGLVKHLSIITETHAMLVNQAAVFVLVQVNW